MSCSQCDGQPQLIASEVAAAIEALRAPRRRDPKRVNQHGGKCTIKYNPSTTEQLSGMRAQATLVDWQSPDGEPRWVTVDVARTAAGGGGSFPGGAGASTAVNFLPSVIGVVPVASTLGFPSSGYFAIKTGSTGVITTGIAYAGITSTSFYGVDPAVVGTLVVGDIIFLPVAYRGLMQVVLGSPSAMEDPFFIDIGRGQRFVASASYVAVTAQALAPPSGFQAGSIALIGRLGHGEAGSLSPVTYTIPIDSLAASAVSNVVIPPKANFLLPVFSSDLNNTIQLEFLDNVGNRIKALSFGNGGQLYPIPLGNAYSINVTNQGAVAANYELPFQIAA